MPKSIKTSERFVAMFDILGFKNLLERVGVKPLVKSIHQLIRAAKGLVIDLELDPLSVYVYQDTICILTEGTSRQELDDLVYYSGILTGVAYYQGLYLRGAITKGEVYRDSNLIIGKAIIRAYQMEQAQEWIGTWIDDECIDAYPGLFPYPPKPGVHPIVIPWEIPMKGGKVKKNYALNWTAIIAQTEMISGFKEAWSRMTLQADSWDARKKVDYTDQFLRYLDTKKYFPAKRLLTTA